MQFVEFVYSVGSELLSFLYLTFPDTDGVRQSSEEVCDLVFMETEEVSSGHLSRDAGSIRQRVPYENDHQQLDRFSATHKDMIHLKRNIGADVPQPLQTKLPLSV